MRMLLKILVIIKCLNIAAYAQGGLGENLNKSPFFYPICNLEEKIDYSAKSLFLDGLACDINLSDFGKFKDVEHLEIKIRHIDRLGELPKEMTKLKSISFVRTHIKESILYTMLKNNPNIRHIYFDDCTFIEDDSINTVIPSIIAIEIRECTFDEYPKMFNKFINTEYMIMRYIKAKDFPTWKFKKMKWIQMTDIEFKRQPNDFFNISNIDTFELDNRNDNTRKIRLDLIFEKKPKYVGFSILSNKIKFPKNNNHICDVLFLCDNKLKNLSNKQIDALLKIANKVWLDSNAVKDKEYIKGKDIELCD